MAKQVISPCKASDFTLSLSMSLRFFTGNGLDPEGLTHLFFCRLVNLPPLPCFPFDLCVERLPGAPVAVKNALPPPPLPVHKSCDS